ncbi:MAG: leucine-rich repeat domain-containing protein [Prevotella sp.]|nr:leucine-rich repeat domain-containing protein [Prevotella sp.]
MMKQYKLIFVFTLFLSLSGLHAYAQFGRVSKLQVDGLYYDLNITRGQAEVVAKPNGMKYAGDISIPVEFTYEGNKYYVTSIGNFAFTNCSDLSSVTIPCSVMNIGVATFAGCPDLTSIVVDRDNIKYDSRDNCNAIIETASNSLIAGCKNTIIPNSVTSIGISAFSGCSSLTSIDIPNSVTDIEDYAFRRCPGLTSVTIPNSVKRIGQEAFLSCSKLSSIVIPDNITSIATEAFDGTAWYNKQPVGVVYLNKCVYKFKGTMRPNTSIKLKEGTQTIASHAFEDSSGLTSITIPNSVKGIGFRAFANCKNLSSITLPDSVTSIGQEVFEGTKWFDKQPDGLVYLNHFAYKYKGTMAPNTSVVLKEGTLHIADHAFGKCSGLTSITIPNSVLSIGRFTFEACSGLTSLIVPDSVKRIDDGAFYFCSNLTQIIIGSNVQYIGTHVFGDPFLGRCKNLETIICKPSVPPTCDYHALDGIDTSTCILQVPQNCIDKYKTADSWKMFKNIIGIDTMSRVSDI